MIKFVKHIYHYFKSLSYLISLFKKRNKNKKAVLVINHFFDQDIESLKLYEKDSDLRFIVVDPKRLFAPIISLFPMEIRRAQIPYTIDSQERNRSISRLISVCLFALLQKATDFKLIVTPSDLYYWLREFVGVSREKGVNTIVLDKEGIISPHYFEYHSKKIKNLFPPISDQFIVWSDRQKAFWRKVGVLDDKIEVIGQPRSDLLFKLEKSSLNVFESESNPLIVFFTYFTNAYIPPELEREKGLSWKDLRHSTHTQIRKLADKYSNVNIVVKCHPQQLDSDEIKEFFRGKSNIKVLLGAKSSNQLLINADLVIGFQSTSMIESVLLGKPTIYTFYSKDVEEFQEGILPFHKYNAFEVVRSERELYEKVSFYINNNFDYKPDKHARQELLNTYLKQVDGQVGKKVIKFLEEYIG